jgi:hypothetical protein
LEKVSGVTVLVDPVLALLWWERVPMGGREKDRVRLDNMLKVLDLGTRDVGVDSSESGGVFSWC